MDDIILLGDRAVFANRRSVSQKEFYEAGILGLKPEFRFDVRFFEYNGEDSLIYEGKRYVIYRTYRRGEYAELYAYRKIGIS